MSDTIRDINGDGQKDFVVNWYGANGCCLKAFSDVYLILKDQMNFSNRFEFINPTFSPDEKIVRGVCYGHPGETEMYKYKWLGGSLDTLEYVYFEKDDAGKRTGRIILATNQPYSRTPPIHRILRRLDSVPDEYKRIEGYDWFMGDL